MRAAEILSILETAYQVEAKPSDWLRDMRVRLGPHMDDGLGVSSYFVDVSDPKAFKTDAYSGTLLMGGEGGRRRFARWHKSVPVAMKRHVHLFGACGTGATIPPMPDGESVVPRTQEAHRLGDMFGVNAIDSTGRGCTFASPLRESRKLDRRRQSQFEHVSVHIAAALRICRKLAEARLAVDHAEAVVSPGGKIEHCEGAAKTSSARAALRDAAVRIDRTRARGQRLEPEEVTDAWQAIIAERWSLVDHFDHDGRRYFIAHTNQPVMPTQRLLSQREAQVIGAATMGHTNEHIAYELGISASSVATHLRRSAKKLGATSRVTVIAAFQELTRSR